MDVTRFYDDLARDYHLIFSDWDASIARQAAIIDRLIAATLGAGPQRVLDRACGIGTQAIGLARLGHQVHATDLSPRAVERAREEATRAGVSLTTGVADLRDLESAVATGPFDVTIAFDNALPHLLSEAEIRQAAASMAATLRPNGLLLASIRDYDAILAAPPSGEPPRVIADPARPGRERIVFQLWEWEPDGLIYTLRHFLIQEGPAGWETTERATRYRALRRAELDAALTAAGLTDVCWLPAEETGFYQPVVSARKR